MNPELVFDPAPLCSLADSSQREAEAEDGSSAGSSFENIDMEGEGENRQPVNFTVGEEDEVYQLNIFSLQGNFLVKKRGILDEKIMAPEKLNLCLSLFFLQVKTYTPFRGIQVRFRFLRKRVDLQCPFSFNLTKNPMIFSFVGQRQH